MTERWDAVVVGAGPNGLAAACVLAEAGRSVLVLEAGARPGGGTRTEELTERGFRHDVCAAIHPMGAASPFFRSRDFEKHGLTWCHPEIALAHPFEDGHAALVYRDFYATCEALGEDGRGYQRLLGPLVERAGELLEEAMRPIRIPRSLFLMARFGLRALRSTDSIVRAFFDSGRTRAMFAAISAHAMLPLDAWGTSAFAMMMLTAGHRRGWPAARGGSQAIADAMISYLRERGGEVRTGHRVTSLRELPESRVVLFDLTPRQMVAIAGDALPPRYRRSLEKFRHGWGSFKIDWSLDGPIPWRAEGARKAGTVHVVGSYEELFASELSVAQGKAPEKPLVVITQQSDFDATRAPEGKRTGWAYCHVPAGSQIDMTERVEAQVERFAPGFRDLIRERHTLDPVRFEQHDANFIGGDIGGGANNLWQILARPVLRWNPYTTPNPRLFMCSSSTPPGGGVHGMCGLHAARAALRRMK